MVRSHMRAGRVGYVVDDDGLWTRRAQLFRLRPKAKAIKEIEKTKVEDSEVYLFRS